MATTLPTPHRANRRSPAVIVRRAFEDFARGTSPAFRRFVGMEPANEPQEICLLSPAQHLYFIGPNATTKSPTGAMRMISRSTGWVPHWARGRMPPMPPRMLPGARPARYVVITISRDQAEEAAWAALNEWLPDEFVLDRQRAGRLIVLRRFVDDPDCPGAPHPVEGVGPRILQRTVEARRLRGQGGQFDGGWIDEEHKSVDVYNEYGIQIGKRDGWIQGTLTPFESLKAGLKTWFAKEVWQPALAARASPQAREVWLDATTHVVFGKKGDQVDAVTGRRMSEADIERRFGSRCSSESEYRLRVCGEYDPAPELPYYPEAAVKDVVAAQKVAPAPRRGLLVETPRGGIEFVPSETGMLHLYDDPEPGEPMTLGVDTASGRAEDFMAAVAWSRRRRRVQAVFHGRIEPTAFKHQFYLMHLFYNRAWMIPETGEFASELIAYIRERAAGRIYRMRSPPEQTESRHRHYGYRTSGTTNRMRLVERVTRALVSGDHALNHGPLVDEIRQFGWFDGRPDHPPGGHDDLIFALALALIGDDECPLPRPEEATSPVRPDERASERYIRKKMEWFGASIRAAATGDQAPEFDPYDRKKIAEALFRDLPS